MNAPSPQQLAYYHTLCSDLGEEPHDPDTMVECTDLINGLRDKRPATQRQINLASRLIRDHMPHKQLPPAISEKFASDLIQSLMQRKPTMAMLQRLVSAEAAVNISAGRQPRTTEQLYDRELRAVNMRGDELEGQLIDATDSQTASWADALVDAANTATAIQDDESTPESEGSSVRTNRSRRSQ